MSEIRVNNIVGEDGVSAPTLTAGLSVTGVVTATSFVGSGANLTGIDATALTDSGGNVKVQANTGGVVVTGILTATTIAGVISSDISSLPTLP